MPSQPMRMMCGTSLETLMEPCRQQLCPRRAFHFQFGRYIIIESNKITNVRQWRSICDQIKYEILNSTYLKVNRSKKGPLAAIILLPNLPRGFVLHIAAQRFVRATLIMINTSDGTIRSHRPNVQLCVPKVR